MLYHAKDNDLLLSLPIPSGDILFARIIGVLLWSLLYEALAYIPALIAFFIFASPSALSVINAVLMFFLLGLFILTLSCLLGWVVALIAGRLKNKSLVSVLASLAFIGIYYYLYFNLINSLDSILQNLTAIETKLRGFSPLYALGRACDGDAVSMLIVSAVILALFIATYAVLSATFRRIATGKTVAAKSAPRDSAVKRAPRESTVKADGLDKALFLREWRRFSSSATYMLNCSLGTLLMPLSGIAALFFREQISAVLAEVPLSPDTLTVILAALCMLIASMNDITSPSISLEGKNLWILQSVPLSMQKVLNAKQRLHLVLTWPAALIMVVCLALAFRQSVSNTIMLLMVVAMFTLFMAAVGLWANLIKPNLDWTNETVPVKQSLSVCIALFGGWFVAAVLGLLGYLALRLTEVYYVLLIEALVLCFLYRLLMRWINSRGVEILARL